MGKSHSLPSNFSVETGDGVAHNGSVGGVGLAEYRMEKRERLPGEAVLSWETGKEGGVWR